MVSVVCKDDNTLEVRKGINRLSSLLPIDTLSLHSYSQEHSSTTKKAMKNFLEIFGNFSPTFFGGGGSVISGSTMHGWILEREDLQEESIHE